MPIGIAVVIPVPPIKLPSGLSARTGKRSVIGDAVTTLPPGHYPTPFTRSIFKQPDQPLKGETVPEPQDQYEDLWTLQFRGDG